MVEAGDSGNAGAAPSLVYRGLRAVARTGLGLFYRHIEVTGLEHIDAKVPTILASTHPNSIVDPVLVGLSERRQVTFCARDGLFRVPGFGALLRAVGAVPIRRRSDHKGGAVDNDAAFAECRAVLVRGGVISIFPEGKTHARLRVEPMKTGTVRIAIDTIQAYSEAELPELHIVPVGLNYLVREAFRSDVHVAFGPPIPVRAALRELQTPNSDPQTHVRALTERMGESIRDLAVHVEHEDDERLIAQVTALIVDIRQAEGLDANGQSPAERTALVQRIIDAYRWLEDGDPVRCARLRERVVAYTDERRRLGLGRVETALQKRGEAHASRLGREDRSLFGPLGLILGAPLALVGAVAAIVPYLLLRVLLLLTRPTAYRVALTKLLGGTALFFGWFALLSYAVFSFAGLWPAVGVGAALLPVAIFAHRYAIDLRLYRFGLRSNLRRLRQRRRFARLRGERRRLQRELARLRQTYLAQLDEPEGEAQHAA
ncbi:acyltransferase domain protein [Plesiocystis pacifica SIR-1]|uniref:Acyltransferase domain protein n=1 Tax=Plesiocystis pacifica SIR-1 TaxID=391625 RepID=A6G0R0_9BACT|nr:lysophospholipid acyltransferase family protein [Plesiocystis pacifica]EDM80448.1 acyltransferase domain protein [Plesiocystis pacifica SIR-1]